MHSHVFSLMTHGELDIMFIASWPSSRLSAYLYLRVIAEGSTVIEHADMRFYSTEFH